MLYIIVHYSKKIMHVGTIDSILSFALGFALNLFNIIKRFRNSTLLYILNTKSDYFFTESIQI